jgi:hypothetical protein
VTEAVSALCQLSEKVRILAITKSQNLLCKHTHRGGA